MRSFQSAPGLSGRNNTEEGTPLPSSIASLKGGQPELVFDEGDQQPCAKRQVQPPVASRGSGGSRSR
ncbi:hypothetical protein THICB2_810016 [Thiomonas sp. CB2]|nr:hypothetical protein THICB2_810016 [Thiomonas sp. CB2]